MRGKRQAVIDRHLGLGLIPAYAGKTNAPVIGSVEAAAHPRVCGENCKAFAEELDAQGSSPRMRGKHLPTREGILLPRLIPAYAGKTKFSQEKTRESRAHPRVCGENGTLTFQAILAWGSSPRMRGKRPGRYHDLIDRRLIPAYAGKTGSRNSYIGRRRAHPRVCGENKGLRKWIP